METKRKNLLCYAKERLADIPFLVISVLYLGFCAFSAVFWSIRFVPGHLLMSLVFMLFIPAMIAVEYFLGLRFGPVFAILALSIAVGGILGSPFSLYSTIPVFDDILHTVSGFVFAALGFSLAELMFGVSEGKRAFFGKLVFAAAFSLGIAVLWELWEFGGMLLLGMETADDTLVSSFTTFLFGGRSEPILLDGITKTVIYYGDGQTLIVDGYLDIGYIDTVFDMVVCTAGTAVFCIAAAVVSRLSRGLLRALVPTVRPVGEKLSGSLSERGLKSEIEVFPSADVCESEADVESESIV